MNNEKLSRCRICLIEDVRMHLILNTHLQDIYEKLTKMPLLSKDCRPLVVCYMCCHRLQKCYELKMDSLKSEEYFIRMLSSKHLQELKVGNVGNHNRMKISPVVHLTVGWGSDENLNENVKNEVFEEQHVEVKMEHMEVLSDPIIEDNNMDDSKEFNESIHSSDPEDDIPLKIVKIGTEKSIRRKTKKKKIILKCEDHENSKSVTDIDAREILLSKEEQMSNLVARSKSMNYTQSPYKCELCYKGFVDETAYQNHKIKHDKRSGCHSCEICHMRYRTFRQLKTHVVTAHSRLFKCNKCGHTTHTASQAKVHEKWHSGFLYECQLCGHKFKKPTSYLTHMRKRHPTESVCEVCGECFVGQLGLQMHKSKAHYNDSQIENDEEPATNRYCKVCDIQFLSREAWNRHILCSSKHKLTSETSECNICGWRGDSTSVSNHMKEHSRRLRQRRPIAFHAANRVPCQCAQCGMKFVSRQNLQAHVNRTHRGIKYNKNIVCEICGKHCTSNATLKYHQRTHTGERPYTCSTCSKQFSDKNQLKLHTRTHTGEKPYECNVCNKRFTQKPTLNRHYRIHTGVKPYTCQHCSRSFTQSNSLKTHVRTVHLKLPTFRNKNDDIKSEEKIQIDENVN